MTLNVLIGNGTWFAAAGGTAPVITSPTSLPTGTANTAYTNTQFIASGTSPITWSSTGTLPTGMTFSSSGLLSGTPTVTANSSITFTATNAYGSNNSPLTLTVSAAGGNAPTITSPSLLLDGLVDNIYPTYYFVASGATPITWSITSGSLPAGLTFSSDGVLSGTPTASSNSTIQFTATNSSGSNSRSLVLSVASLTDSSPIITSYRLLGGVQGTAYSDTLSAIGGNITWSIVSGSISPLTLNSSTGEISGTPTSASALSAVFRASNANGTQDLTLSIPVLATGSAPSGLPTSFSGNFYVGYARNVFLQASAGDPAIYSLTINSGSLPSWANFTSRGGRETDIYGAKQSAGPQVWGTPTSTGTTNATYTFNNGVSPNATTVTIPITVTNFPNTAPRILSTSLPAARDGVAYSNQLYAIGMPESFTWAITSGNKPSWLNISSSGLMTGTPGSGDVTSGIILTFSCTNSAGTTNSGNIGFEVKAANAKTLLSPSDFTYLGYYDCDINGSDNPYNSGLTVRRVGSEVRLITQLYDKDWFAEFSLSGKTPATSGSPSSCKITTLTRVWDNAGAIPRKGTYFHWDESLSKLFVNWAEDYPATTQPTQLWTATLTDGTPRGTVTNARHYLLDGVPDRRCGTGWVSVPASYQSAYGWGPVLAGTGGYFSLVAQRGEAALGLSMYSIPDPSSYPTDTTFTTSQYKILAARGSVPSRKKENALEYGISPNTVYGKTGPDKMGYWDYNEQYTCGAFIDTDTKYGFFAVGGFSGGRVWYERSYIYYSQRIAECHIYDPGDLYRISQGNQLESIEPLPQNTLQFPETRQTGIALNGQTPLFKDNYYNAMNTGGPGAFYAAYDSIGKVLYIQINVAGAPNGFGNRIYAYAVNV
jgi:hypothetical protein